MSIEPAQSVTTGSAESVRTGGRRPGQRTLRRPASTETPTTSLDHLRARLLESVAGHYPQADLAQVGAAFDLAVAAHADQHRASGEAYVTHPIAAAQIVADLGIDATAVEARPIH